MEFLDRVRVVRVAKWKTLFKDQSQIELFAVCFKCCFEASLGNLLREDVNEKKFVA